MPGNPDSHQSPDALVWRRVGGELYGCSYIAGGVAGRIGEKPHARTQRGFGRGRQNYVSVRADRQEHGRRHARYPAGRQDRNCRRRARATFKHTAGCSSSNRREYSTRSVGRTSGQAKGPRMTPRDGDGAERAVRITDGRMQIGRAHV